MYIWLRPYKFLTSYLHLYAFVSPMVQLSKLHDFRVSFVLHINKKEIFGTNSITSESHILYFVTFSPRTNILISVCFFSSVTTKYSYIIYSTLSLTIHAYCGLSIIDPLLPHFSLKLIGKTELDFNGTRLALKRQFCCLHSIDWLCKVFLYSFHLWTHAFPKDLFPFLPRHNTHTHRH